MFWWKANPLIRLTVSWGYSQDVGPGCSYFKYNGADKSTSKMAHLMAITKCWLLARGLRSSSWGPLCKATWVSSWYDSCLLPEWVIQERARGKTQYFFKWSTFRSHTVISIVVCHYLFSDQPFSMWNVTTNSHEYQKEESVGTS